MAYTPLVDKHCIVVGKPLPFSIYDGDCKLLLAEGRVVESERLKERLLALGVLCAVPEKGSRRERCDKDASEAESPIVALQRNYAQIAARTRGGLRISPKETGDAYLCWVLGQMRDKRCLVLSAPVRADKSLVSITKGETWFCRFLNATTAFRFRGVVLKTALDPFPHFLLEVSRTIEKRTVRVWPRALVSFPATVRIPHDQEAEIVDLSVGGARIAVDKTNPLVKGQRIALSTQLRALNTEHAVEVLANVVVAYGNIDPQHPDFLFYGIEFELPEQLQLLALHACVQEHIVAELDGLAQLLTPELVSGDY